MITKEERAARKAERAYAERRQAAQHAAEHMAVRFLVLGEKPDFEETIRWREHGDDFVVTLRGYGLARADAGVVIQIWGELTDCPLISVAPTLDLTTADAYRDCAACNQYQLAEAYERLRKAVNAAVRGES